MRDRKAATLCPIIMKNIPQHDRVILHTDEFSSYKKLSDHYFHYTCNHSKADYAHTDELPAKLGSGELEVTINHLESDWGELKSMVLHHMNKVCLIYLDFMYSIVSKNSRHFLLILAF